MLCNHVSGGVGGPPAWRQTSHMALGLSHGSWLLRLLLAFFPSYSAFLQFTREIAIAVKLGRHYALYCVSCAPFETRSILQVFDFCGSQQDRFVCIADCDIF